MELYLIRHAQSANNANPESRRVHDPSLTDVGHQQASRLAKRIDCLGLTRIITSPFLRTLETTEKIRSATSIKPEVRINLHEEGGCYSGHLPSKKTGQPGLNRSQIEERFPEFDVETALDGQGWWNSQPFESRERAQKRAEMLLKQTHIEFAGSTERVAFVMHGNIKLLLLENVSAASSPFDMPFNASVTKVLLTTNGFQLAEFNRVDHLPPRLITF